MNGLHDYTLTAPVINEDGETLKEVEFTALFDDDLEDFWGITIEGVYYNKFRISEYFLDEIRQKMHDIGLHLDDRDCLVNHPNWSK